MGLPDPQHAYLDALRKHEMLMALCPQHAHLSASHGGCATLHGDDGVTADAVALREIRRHATTLGDWVAIAERALAEKDERGVRMALAHIRTHHDQIKRSYPS